MHKPLTKKIACAKKEHDNNSKEKCPDKSKWHHKRCHGLGKHHIGKCKKFFCDYHGLCHHDMDKCNFTQSCRKHVQPMYQSQNSRGSGRSGLLRMLKSRPRNAA
eukprot:11801935-Ditylum_brightwellii.AAC.1